MKTLPLHLLMHHIIAYTHCLYTLPHTHCLIHIANITSSTEQNRTEQNSTFILALSIHSFYMVITQIMHKQKEK